jgi:Xaa-Pro aminopeptidase
VDHALRRSRITAHLEELGADALLVTHLPNVRYLTGFSGSNGQAVLTVDGGRFLTDGRYDEQSRREVQGLERVIYSGSAAPVVATACADLGVPRVAFETTAVNVDLFQELTALGIALVPTQSEVERLRWVKDAEELEHLRAAQAIADRVFEAIVPTLAPRTTERELALALDIAMRREGADGPAFETIVAFGESAAEPHHEPTPRMLERGDVVKMDFGCAVAGYHSDMTRTVAFGDPPDELARVYKVVQEAQQAGVEAIRSGATGGEVDAVCRGMIAAAGYGPNFSHGLGHGVGLEIHEGPSLRAGGTDVLPAGAVVTVEPGVYLPGLGGVRIEDMVEVTDSGGRVVPAVPKDLLIL